MARPHLDRLDDLPALAASDVKKHGWRGVMRSVRERGVVLITNHKQPEAVVVSPETYAGFVELAAKAGSSEARALDALRLRFDDRLAALAAPGADARLRSVMRGPTRLRGRVKARTPG